MAITKQQIIDYVIQWLGPMSVVKVAEFETTYTRHICQGERMIQILESSVVNVPIYDGFLPVRVIICTKCGKLWIDGSTVEVPVATIGGMYNSGYGY